MSGAEAPAKIAAEVTELARALIRIDTSNPPGHETPAARLLGDYLGANGVECELAGPDPDRLNVIARVPGGDGPSLMLMAHTDVVPAPREGWTVDPFEGLVRDGMLFGRGATDMKNELAARAVAVADLARSGEPPPGDVVLIAESDEERNTADVGMPWLVRERPDIRCDYALNEGGGTLLELIGGRRVITVGVGEKQVTSIRIRLRAAGGHASVPDRASNPLALQARAIERLLDHRAPTTLPAAVRAGLADAGAEGSDDEIVEWAAAQHAELGAMVGAMSRLTVTPTGSHAGEPPNVVPGHADVICDCRALPDQSEADIRAHVAEALGDLPHELELLEPLAGGTESPVDTSLYEVLARYAAERANATLLPLVSPGFSDSYWVRRDLGMVAYGFSPVIAGDPVAYHAAAHAADESIALADLAEMAEFHRRAVTALGAL